MRYGEKPVTLGVAIVATSLQVNRMSVHRFKAAYNLRDVPLRSFNVLVGRNGAGKSTLLEALQWIDTAVRHTTDAACDRYNGVQDLINHRYSADLRGFELNTRLEAAGGAFAQYTCGIAEDGNHAKVHEEQIRIGEPGAPTGNRLLRTEGGVRLSDHARLTVEDRLALSRIEEFLPEPHHGISGKDIAAFWRDAVFLRLEPTDLARGGTLKRSSVDPLLDEVGTLLTALIEGLDNDARDDLVDMLQSVLPDFRGIEVMRSGDNRSGNYALREDIVYRGRAGSKEFLIPAWMLSEGTRRMTAIFTLLARRPGPSLLCIEEVENGLDPIAVRKVLHHLQAAAGRGVQVILTTHSPWLLDEVPIEAVQVVRRVQGDTTYTRLQDDPGSIHADPRVLPGGRYLDLLDR
jgi:predicted ATPase